jgi:hypothetical protein
MSDTRHLLVYDDAPPVVVPTKPGDYVTTADGQVFALCDTHAVPVAHRPVRILPILDPPGAVPATTHASPLASSAPQAVLMATAAAHAARPAAPKVSWLSKLRPNFDDGYKAPKLDGEPTMPYVDARWVRRCDGRPTCSMPSCTTPLPDDLATCRAAPHFDATNISVYVCPEHMDKYAGKDRECVFCTTGQRNCHSVELDSQELFVCAACRTMPHVTRQLCDLRDTMRAAKRRLAASTQPGGKKPASPSRNDDDSDDDSDVLGAAPTSPDATQPPDAQ